MVFGFLGPFGAGKSTTTCLGRGQVVAGGLERYGERGSMRTLTVAELSEQSGRSKKAVRSLLDKKRLPFVVGSDGLRRVPEEAAIAYGLIGVEGQRSSRATARGTSDGAGVVELAEKLMTVSQELGRMRALVETTELREKQERAEVERLQQRVFELEVELRQAEQRRRKWFPRLVFG